MNVKLRLKRYRPVALGFVLQAAPGTPHSRLILLDGGLVLAVLEQLVALLLVVGLGLAGPGYGRGVRLLAVRPRVAFIAAPAPGVRTLYLTCPVYINHYLYPLSASESSSELLSVAVRLGGSSLSLLFIL